MKSPLLAFLLSFFFPGLGLVYTGHRWQGVVNLLIALAVPPILIWLWPDSVLEFLHYVMLAIAAGSGGLAHAAALKTREAPTPTQVIRE